MGRYLFVVVIVVIEITIPVAVCEHGFHLLSFLSPTDFQVGLFMNFYKFTISYTQKKQKSALLSESRFSI